MQRHMYTAKHIYMHTTPTPQHIYTQSHITLHMYTIGAHLYMDTTMFTDYTTNQHTSTYLYKLTTYIVYT